MNNYRNYGNYGNRRVAGGMGDCGCGGKMMANQMHRMQEADCGCKKNDGMQERDYGCKKEDMMKEKDCGCKKEDMMREKDCGCKKEDMMREKDCGCWKDDGMKGTDCGCAVESMYRDVKKNEMCDETDMPGKALAMAYVPWQSWRKLYEICEGFSTGTIFKELDLEFYGRRCN